ncbi:hypothetical protein CMEL01_14710 [Colletotrichum melonis]|uniref:Uncharacterized protein n=1 Tax=Colletotrichum melonis TaxID=1209925 RepID=A0AAI9US31_9PEZI|nr:hypothetical protein CMEL01_14710 [Colletotrichum melonis]
MSGIPCRFHWCGHNNPTLPTRAVWPFDEGAKDKQGAEQALKSGPLHNQCWRDSPTFFSKRKSLSTNGLPHSFSGGSGCVPVGEDSASWWESGSFATDIPYVLSQPKRPLVHYQARLMSDKNVFIHKFGHHHDERDGALRTIGCCPRSFGSQDVINTFGFGLGNDFRSCAEVGL